MTKSTLLIQLIQYICLAGALKGNLSQVKHGGCHHDLTFLKCSMPVCHMSLPAPLLWHTNLEQVCKKGSLTFLTLAQFLYLCWVSGPEILNPVNQMTARQLAFTEGGHKKQLLLLSLLECFLKLWQLWLWSKDLYVWLVSQLTINWYKFNPFLLVLIAIFLAK